MRYAFLIFICWAVYALPASAQTTARPIEDLYAPAAVERFATVPAAEDLLQRLPPVDPGGPIDLGPTLVGPKADALDPPSVEEVDPESVDDDDMGSLLDDSVVVDEDGELIEVTWYQPWSWFNSKLWEPRLELGLNNSTGNTEVTSARTGGAIKRETKRRKFNADFYYARAEADGMETENQALANLRRELLFQDMPWTLFWQGSLEYDEFRAFDLRLATNSGFGYRLIDSDTASLTTRLGSGVSHELGSPDKRYIPEAVFGTDIEWQVTEAQKLLLNVNYFPEWQDFDDFRLNAEAGWEVVLDAENNLSLKLSAIDRYDSTPNGRKPNDLNTALVLIWQP